MNTSRSEIEKMLEKYKKPFQAYQHPTNSSLVQAECWEVRDDEHESVCQLWWLEEQTHDAHPYENDELLAHLISLALNAYTPPKPCGECGGSGEYKPPPGSLSPSSFGWKQKCPTCNGTGEQPDERDKVIRELVGALEIAHESMSAGGGVPQYYRDRIPEIEAALARAKEVTG